MTHPSPRAEICRDSMLYWYLQIKDLDIPQPKTTVIELRRGDVSITDSIRPSASLVDRVIRAATPLKAPFFLRTDLASGKHEWLATCFVPSLDGKVVESHVERVIEFNLCADLLGLPFRALVVREYIPMDEAFTAFLGTPINPERRYFVKDGAVTCHHPYWIEDAIRFWHPFPEPCGWRELLKKANTETPEEVDLLSGYALKAARVLEGSWSVDFCRGRDGTWYLIDCATAERSYHPTPCQFARMEEGT